MASQITLDGYTYDVLEYDRNQHKVGALNLGLTADWDRLETDVFVTTYRVVLRVNTTYLGYLRTSYNKTASTGTPPTNLLNFVDLEGFNWNPATGSNDSTHAYSTGVYFTEMGKPERMTKRDLSTSNLYRVEIELAVNADGLTT
jgi:hypothetical protein